MTATASPPFTEADYAARMRRAAGQAAEAGLAGLLVTPGPDLDWLCGHRPATTDRLTLLVLRPDRDPRLLVPEPERSDAGAAPGAGAVETTGWRDGADPYRAAARLLRRGGGRGAVRYAISDTASAGQLLGLQQALPAASFTALTAALPLLRAVKDERELACLAAAGAAADAVYREIVQLPFAGRREREVAADLARLLRSYGHERVDLTVVGSGPNGADPRHATGERLIVEGDTVVLDFGGLKGGYGSATARTVHVGEAGRQEREVHEIVRAAQQAAVEAVAPGVPCREVDRAARTVVEKAGYGDRFPHRTGRGVGVTTGEPPRLAAGEDRPLAEGMCFAVAPGLYLPGRFGVRLGDVVRCTGTGGSRLNATGHELRTVA